MSSSIRSRSEWWRQALLVIALCWLVPLPAVGAELTAAAKARARVQFSEGNQAYEQGDFRKALAAFEAAYQLAPLPGFLFNVAQCHRQLGAFEHAASAYRRYLSLSEKEPPNAAMVKELIVEMDAQAGQKAASRAAPEKAVAPAKVVAKDRPEAVPARSSEAPGEPKRERTGLKEAEGKGLDIRTSRSMSASRKSLPPAAQPAPGPVTPAPEPRESLARKWWVWAGAGAVVLLAGGVVYAVTASPDPRPTTLGTIPAR